MDCGSVMARTEELYSRLRRDVQHRNLYNWIHDKDGYNDLTSLLHDLRISIDTAEIMGCLKPSNF